MRNHYYCRSRSSGKYSLHSKFLWLGTIVFCSFLAFGGIILFRHSVDANNAVEENENIDEINLFQETEAPNRRSREEILLQNSNGGSQTVASREVEDYVFRHTIVSHLPNPAEGYYYEGWLLRESPFDFFSTGSMVKNADGTYALVWEGTRKKDYIDYARVIITLETNDGNTGPSTSHVLEGDFVSAN